jgi:hypothetical protein
MTMKRVLAMLLGAATLFALFGATTGSAAPGPNGSNDKGLCTAYFNGQKKGHEEGNSPGPFGVLEDEAADPEDSDDEDLADEQQVSDDVLEYCNSLGVVIGGNPEHNGRWDCSDDEGDKKSGTPRDSDDDGELECVPQGTEP